VAPHQVNNVIGQGLLVKKTHGQKTVIAEKRVRAARYCPTPLVAARLGLECYDLHGRERHRTAKPQCIWMKQSGATLSTRYHSAQTLRACTRQSLRDWFLSTKTAII